MRSPTPVGHLIALCEDFIHQLAEHIRRDARLVDVDNGSRGEISVEHVTGEQLKSRVVSRRS